MNHRVEDADAALIRQALAGDAGAFTLLAERYRPMLFALCLHWTHNPTDAEDLTQETLLRAFDCLWQVREPERFRAWLARTAINLCKNWSARGRHDLWALDATVAPGYELDLTDGILLQQALAALPAELRQAICWFYLDGLSRQDIAVLWHLPPSTVKGRLDLGRRRLRREFEKMGVLPEEMADEAIVASHVALTEANADEAKRLRGALKQAGFACTILKPDDLILPKLRRIRPDVLIVCSPFGELDEYQILQALRIDQRLRGTSVMFLTPRNDSVSIFKAWNMGIDAYLTVPWEVAEVVHFVGRIDRSRRSRDYVGLAVEYAWRRQTEATLKCLEKAIGVIEQTEWITEDVAKAIRTEAAFNYLRSTPEFAALLAQLPAQERPEPAVPEAEK
jgi:RNA polymerase sigma-70 factor (ECF subfamily)